MKAMNRSLVCGLAVVLLLWAHDASADQEWTNLSLSGEPIKHSEKAYGDLEAEFEFSRIAGHSFVGLVVRAQDARRYYVVEFPFCGQQIREGHFWAAITRMDETGYAKVLMLERVPGVPGEAGLWHQARVVVKGDEIRLWVNGRPLPPVRDAAYPAVGRVGMVQWNDCGFRNLRIRGTETLAPAWDEAAKPVQNWFRPTPSLDGCPYPKRAPNGDLLMSINKSVMRSTDQGRTWKEVWRTETDRPSGVGALAKTADGRMILVRQSSVANPCLIEVTDSTDNGQSWSPFVNAGELKFAEAVNYVSTYGQVLELRDGALAWFGFATVESPTFVEGGHRYRPAQIPGRMCFCIRSEDGGRTWSAPVNIDGPNPRPDQWMSFKDQVSEVTAMETLEGEIVVFNRPGTAWAMWETRSKDGGKTWTPMSTGPFLSYASAAVPRATASGALVVGGRFPALAIYVSRDNGMTWETYQADTETWAMGNMYEVAPDVVLYLYGSQGGGALRAQLIQITPDGIKPIR